jgi:hypothetical protein
VFESPTPVSEDGQPLAAIREAVARSGHIEKRQGAHRGDVGPNSPPDRSFANSPGGNRRGLEFAPRSRPHELPHHDPRCRPAGTDRGIARGRRQGHERPLGDFFPANSRQEIVMPQIKTQSSKNTTVYRTKDGKDSSEPYTDKKLIQ